MHFLFHVQTTLKGVVDSLDGIEDVWELQVDVCVLATEAFFRVCSPNPRQGIGDAWTVMIQETNQVHDKLLVHVQKSDATATLPPPDAAANWIDYPTTVAEGVQWCK